MSLCVKAALSTGRIWMQQPGILRLPPIVMEQRRTAMFTLGKKRPGLKRERRPRPVPEPDYVSVADLYAKEIDTSVFDARQPDLPKEGMENPFISSKRLCTLCKYNITPDYKNVKLLSQFISPHTGRVYGRHITGLCRTQQERIEAEIIKSRFAGLMSYYLKSPEFFKDPKLCDPARPTRPHPY